MNAAQRRKEKRKDKGPQRKKAIAEEKARREGAAKDGPPKA